MELRELVKADGAAAPATACLRGMARAALAAALLAGALSLAACGGSSGGPAGSGPAASSGTRATAIGTSAAPATTPGGRAAITVRSPAFAGGGTIPVRFTCRGSNVPVPLTWAGVPSGTLSVALVLDDPDAPSGTFTHWVVFNLPATATGITGGRLPSGAAEAQNSNGRAAYLGPCPPSGTHHYRFTVYAEPKRLPLRAGAPLAEALHAITAQPLASGRLTGLVSG